MGSKRKLLEKAQEVSDRKKGKTDSSVTKPKSSTNAVNKTKVLIFGTRGISSRHRYLMNDLKALLPHSKKESKMDPKEPLSTINEIAELTSSTHVMFFEARGRGWSQLTDLFLWIGATPGGPSVCFQVTNIHTMSELKLTGNCLKGARSFLSFDASFSKAPHLALIQEMFTQCFGVPKGHVKSKPFVDHVLSFHILDNRIWMRVYQVVIREEGKRDPEIELVEIGPRMVLNPIRILEGSFAGKILYENPDYQSSISKKRGKLENEAMRYFDRVQHDRKLFEKRQGLDLPTTQVDNLFRDE